MSKESSSTSKMISLKAVDNIIFEVEASIAMKIRTVKYFIEESDDTAAIPLPNVIGKHLSMVVEYCMNQGTKDTKEAKKKFEAEFVKRLSNGELKELILTANYLNIKSLLDFLSQGMAYQIKDRSVEFVRKYLGIENDFTLEEEAKLRKECEWAYDGVNKDKE